MKQTQTGTNTNEKTQNTKTYNFSSSLPWIPPVVPETPPLYSANSAPVSPGSLQSSPRPPSRLLLHPLFGHKLVQSKPKANAKALAYIANLTAMTIITTIPIASMISQIQNI